MQTHLFDYELPPDRIAQRSVEPRDQARMLVLDCTNGQMDDRHVFDLPAFLRPGDLIVLNNSKVFKARLRLPSLNGELFLLRPEGDHWLALVKPGRKVKTNDRLELTDGSISIVVDKTDDGTVRIDFQKSSQEVFALAERIGEIPVPPYVTQHAPTPSNSPFERGRTYQTIYAEKMGSVAAPTAGFHFTLELFKRLEERGVKKAFVTLHVGLGTFRPMKTDTLEEHVMHEEWVEIPEETRRAIEETKNSGGRVIAIGTTTVRALESGKNGFTNLFITPDYSFKVIDGLLTNFHLPKSTLLVLVSAFAGRENILRAYQHAIETGYRFYSFGDAMFIAS